jgi:hypothetical protein
MENILLVHAFYQQASEIIHTGYCYLHPLMENAFKKIPGITGPSKGIE